ncbi:MAG TPA: serine hydrolase [Exilispira sp.]|nr:serine hydrolase [Exilispira sp.]
MFKKRYFFKKATKIIIINILAIFLIIISIGIFFNYFHKNISKEDNLIKNHLDKLIDENISTKLGGYGFILFDDKGKIWSNTGGYINANNESFKDNTVFYIGELSQHFTFLSLLKLEEEGKIDLEKNLSYYLPEIFNSKNQNLNIIGQLKIINILKNRTGFISLLPKSLKKYDFNNDIKYYLERLNQFYNEDSKYTESNIIIDVLGLLIQKITHKGFENYIDDQIFKKIGMKYSSFISNKKLKNESLFFAKTEIIDLYSDIELLSPSISMKSSLSDLIKFYSLLISREKVKDNRNIIPEKYIYLISSPSNEYQLNLEGYETSMGWYLNDINLTYIGPVLSKSGSFLTHRVLVFLLPNYNIGLICASNTYNWGEKQYLYDYAIKILKSYVNLKYNINEPEFIMPEEKEIPVDIKKNCQGFYASNNGLINIKIENNYLILSYKGGYAKFAYFEQNQFLPVENNEYKMIKYILPDKIILVFKSKAQFIFTKLNSKINYLLPLKEGIYQCQNSSIFPSYFILKNYDYFSTITLDDGNEYLIIPTKNNSYKILSDQTFIFYNKNIFYDLPDAIYVGDNKYMFKTGL